MTTYEIQMSGRFYYQKAHTEQEAASIVKKNFGGHFSHAFATGRTRDY